MRFKWPDILEIWYEIFGKRDQGNGMRNLHVGLGVYTDMKFNYGVTSGIASPLQIT